jgi:hypothetical protein
MTRLTPLWLQAGTYPAAIDRRLSGALWPNPQCDGAAVTFSSGMTVNVDPGQIAVPTPNATGTCLCVSDAPEQVALAPAGATGSDRIDLVICQLRGTDLDNGANNDFIYTSVTGVASGTPVVPDVPPGAVVLAQVAIPGGSAAIDPANITDRRPGTLAIPQPPFYTPPTFTQPNVFASLADCQARWPAPPKGAEAWFTDTDTPWQWNGAKWIGKPMGVIDAVVGTGAWCHATYVTIIQSHGSSFKAGRRYKISAWYQGGNVTALGNLLFDLRDWGSPENRQTLFNGPVAVGSTGGQSINGGGFHIYDPPSTQSRTFLIAGSISAGEFRTGPCGITVEDVGSP